MHFLTNAGKHAFRLLKEVKPEFLELAKELTKVTTVSAYNEIRDKMELLCGDRTEVKEWINWWDVRKCNLFPAFRGVGFSGGNLAEPGHVKFKRKNQMSLVR